MSQPTTFFVTAIFAVVSVGALMFGCTYVALRWTAKERRERDLQRLQLERASEQLRDFYGPLHALLLATRGVNKVAWGTDIWERAWGEIILPSYLQIEIILLTKIHLLEDDEIPASFLDFLQHSMINRSYKDIGLNLDYLDKGVSYPEQFTQDIAKGYEHARSNYLRLLKER